MVGGARAGLPRTSLLECGPVHTSMSLLSMYAQVCLVKAVFVSISLPKASSPSLPTTQIWMAGSALFTLGGLFLSYRHFVMGTV